MTTHLFQVNTFHTMEAEFDTQLLDLPKEMILEIISYVSCKDQLSLSLVNRELFTITKDAIEKQTILKLFFPFPDLCMDSLLSRNYQTVSLRYWDFVYEYETTKRFVKLLQYGPRALNLQVYIDAFKSSELFDTFIGSNRNLKTVKMDNNYNDLIDHCLKKFSWIELQVLRATLSVKQTTMRFNADSLENLELFNSDEDHIDEIDLIKNLGTFRKLKRLQAYRVKTAERPIECKQLMKEFNFFELSKMKTLDLYYSEEIAENSSFLCLFRNLESLTCHFQDTEIDYSEESFKFAQTIFANNEETLKTLILKIVGIPQIISFLPKLNSKIRLNELNFFSSDTNDHSQSLLTQLLDQQSLYLRKLTLEGITLNEDIFGKIVSIGNLEEFSLQTCEVDFSYANILNLKRLKIAFSSISRDCLKSILENEHFQNSIDVLHLDDFQMSYSEADRFEQLLFPNLKCLIYRTYGDAEEVEHFIQQLEAPLLEFLKYGFVWNSAPSFQKFSNLKVLVVQPLYKSVDEINLLLILEKLEVLEIFVELKILSEVLKNICKESNQLRICIIKCHSKYDLSSNTFSKLSEICENFVENQSYNFKINKNENNDQNFVQIIDRKLTVCVHLESNVLYYYEDLINKYFDF